MFERDDGYVSTASDLDARITAHIISLETLARNFFNTGSVYKMAVLCNSSMLINCLHNRIDTAATAASRSWRGKQCVCADLYLIPAITLAEPSVSGAYFFV